MLRMGRLERWFLTIGCLSLVFILWWIACSQKSPMDTMESLQEEITLLTDMMASPSRIVVGGEQSVIRVRLVNQDGIPLSDSVIVFSTDLGSIVPQDTTDVDGWAETLLVSGPDEGKATVTAQYKNISTTTITVDFISTLDAQLRIRSGRDEILANGIDTTTVTVTLTADSGQVIPETAVMFSTDLGSITSMVVMDGSGVARSKLTSAASGSDAIATVTAIVDTLSAVVTVKLKGVQFSLDASPTSVLADGNSTSVITAGIKETTSQVGISNAKVRFGTTLGSIPAEVNTNNRGMAEVSLISETTVGTAVVTATYGNTFQDTALVQFVPPDVPVLSEVTASPDKILANGVAQSSISAKVMVGGSEPVPNVTVQFSTTEGQITAQGITDYNGVASAWLTSTADSGDVTATVTARLDTQSVTTDVLFLGIEHELTASPSTIIADGQSTSTIRVLLKQRTNNIAISDATILFGTDLGTIPNQATTNAEGVAEVLLRSGTVTGTANVVFHYGNLISDTVQVTIQQSIPTYLEVSATPPVIPADGQTESLIKATVSDGTQNPVPDGIPVFFSIIEGTGGTIVNQQVTSGGSATSALTSTSVGSIKIRVSVALLEDTVEVVCTVGPVDQILVSSDRDSMAADGIETARIEANVMDAQGNPVSDVVVSFSASIGDVTQTAPTNFQGIAVANFSSSSVGTATITASVGLVSGFKIIQLLPGGPNSIVLRFTPTSIGVKETGQVQTAMVEAEVRDSKNNPVVDGTLVRFSILAGPGGGESLSSTEPIPTVSGIARVSLSSGTVSGNVRVEAEVIDDLGFPVVAIASELLIHAGEAYMEDVYDLSTTHLTVAGARLNIWATLDTTRISIMVVDKYNNPVQPGTAVYLTTSGGGINTHTAYTDEYGKAGVVLTAGNPQPTIDRFYNYYGMDDPNLDTVIPGYIYYPDLGEFRIPNYDAFPDGNYPGTIGGRVLNTEGDSLENDGITRIMTYSEGKDVNGDSVRVWDWLSVVFSGPIAYFEENSSVTLPPILSPGESATIRINIMDARGNPIACGSTVKAALIPDDVQARLSWDTIVTGRDQGTSYYYITISNAIKPTDPKPGTVFIKISVDSVNGIGFIGTNPVYISEF